LQYHWFPLSISCTFSQKVVCFYMQWYSNFITSINFFKSICHKFHRGIFYWCGFIVVTCLQYCTLSYCGHSVLTKLQDFTKEFDLFSGIERDLMVAGKTFPTQEWILSKRKSLDKFQYTHTTFEKPVSPVRDTWSGD
jgi:hypothetical protein